MNGPDPQAVNAAAAQLLGDTPRVVQEGTMWDLIERFSQDPVRAQEFLGDLVDLLDRHLERGLSDGDVTLVFSVLQAHDATASWLEEGGSPQRQQRLDEDGFALTSMVLGDHPCATCAGYVLATALLSHRLTHAAALQRRAADRREDGDAR